MVVWRPRLDDAIWRMADRGRDRQPPCRKLDDRAIERAKHRHPSASAINITPRSRDFEITAPKLRELMGTRDCGVMDRPGVNCVRSHRPNAQNDGKPLATVVISAVRGRGSLTEFGGVRTCFGRQHRMQETAFAEWIVGLRLTV